MAQLAAKNARVGTDIALEATMDAPMDATMDATADAPPLAPGDAAIDRAHLGRMTHGERDLEREVLQLYATQTDLLLGRMRQSPPAAVGALAHTLNGSSRGIGAWQVADAAAAVEADAADGRDTAASVERLASAIRAAQAHIVELFRESA
jgi:Hpt domain-containing protein